MTALTYLYFKLESDTALYSLPSVTGGTAPRRARRPGSARDVPGGAVGQDGGAAPPRLHGPGHAGRRGHRRDLRRDAGLRGPRRGRRGHRGRRHADTDRRGADHRARPRTTRADGTFSVRRGGTGAARPGPAHPPADPGGRRRGEHATSTSGIEPEDQVDYTYPFPMSIDVIDIGGPVGGTGHDARGDRHPERRLAHRRPHGGRHRHHGRRRRRGRRRAAWPRRRSPSRTPGRPSSSCRPRSTGRRCRRTGPGLRIYAVSTLDQALRRARGERGPRRVHHARRG